MMLSSPAALSAPRYGTSSLADLIPAVLASIGTPDFHDALDLPPAAAACVLLVDGLGAELIRANAAYAPVLAGALASGRDLTAGFPSTTAVSIASIGTGLPPGSHGVLGYTVAIPGTGRLMNSLKWDPSVEPASWQPNPTAFERAQALGTSVTDVAKSAIQHGGLTEAALRGAAFVPAETFGDVAACTIGALESAVASRRPGLVYSYVADLDSNGHLRGVDSLAWRLQLQLIDRLVEQIADRLPASTSLYVTADHGMVDVAAARRIDVDADPEWRAGVELLGGEPRARYLYVTDGALDDVVSCWRSRLGIDAVVLTREEAIEAGWFGPVSPFARPRIGDVVVAAVSDIAIVAGKASPHEAALIGHHGSATPAEQLVPLATFGC
jgi:hypothetical protein